MKQLLFIFIFLFCLITAKSQEPAITMTAALGSPIRLIIHAKVSNTIVKVDFGDGKFVESSVAFTNGYSSDIVGTVKVTQLIKIYGSEITQLSCSSNELTTLDVTKCPSLISLWCEANQLKKLDVSKNPGLEVIDCSENRLTSLDITNLTALERIDCGENQISNLTINNNPALTEIFCTSNQLTFATLPLVQSTGIYYIYGIQNKTLIPKSINIETPLDLSNQYSIHGNSTNYEWCIKNGPRLVENVDYSISAGKTTFLKIPADSVVCYMTNATFPRLNLETTYIKVTKRA